jgi:hypothetical protein
LPPREGLVGQLIGRAQLRAEACLSKSRSTAEWTASTQWQVDESMSVDRRIDGFDGAVMWQVSCFRVETFFAAAAGTLQIPRPRSKFWADACPHNIRAEMGLRLRVKERSKAGFKLGDSNEGVANAEQSAGGRQNDPWCLTDQACEKEQGHQREPFPWSNAA